MFRCNHYHQREYYLSLLKLLLLKINQLKYIGVVNWVV
jgi:hypothetical protein